MAGEQLSQAVDKLCQAVCEKLGVGETDYCWCSAIFASEVVCCWYKESDSESNMLKMAFTRDGNGNFSLGDPVPVRIVVSYQEIEKA